jgi:leucyl aminopeptidase
MNNLFLHTSTFKKTNIEMYIFIICNHLKENIQYISTLLNVKDIPKKIFENNTNLKKNFEKTLYKDNFEIFFVGIGRENKCDNSYLYSIFGKIGKNIKYYYNNDKKNKVFIHLVSDDEIIIRNQIHSYILGFYKFTHFKTNQRMDNVKTYFYHPKQKFKKIIEDAIYEATVQNEVRSLANTPANILNSKIYTQYIQKNSFKNIKIKIYNETQLKKMGCNLIVGVNQGSKNKPYLVVLEYKNISSKHTPKPIALIGKGVMFDSGGYNLKTGDFSDMKNDMTGSAIVYALFKLFSKFKIHGHFIGLLPIVENMVNSNAIRPGDILKAYNGKTIEITNTDAEGRLIMADALSFSKKFHPHLCIDIATLTGQAGSIFGNKSSVIMGNNNKYIQQMIQSGVQHNEKIWELPMWEEYIELTRSKIADFKNLSYDAKAGTIMAGAFLSNFIPEKTNWIHLDIAGVDSLNNETKMRNFGATGEILRTLFHFLKNFNSNK